MLPEGAEGLFKPVVSVVIPAFNEENNIGDVLFRTHETLNALKFPFEILVVDDDPDIIEAIPCGDEPDGISLEKLRKNLPARWDEQRKAYKQAR